MKKALFLLTIVFCCGVMITLYNFYAYPVLLHAMDDPAIPTVILPNFSSLAKKLTPVTVNISTTKTVKPNMQQFGTPFGGSDQFDQFHDFFGDDFYRHFFGDQKEYKQQSLGSGFIIDREGYILTNNHVVEGADAIKVKMHTKSEYDANVVGRDPETDLALIKLKSLNESLPVATLGDSDALDVGDWVLAVGNPFGLQETITAGIVSAKLRKNLGTGRYESYIQTDASINPGNSGGPLFNTHGQVIGVNTMIFTPSGGNVGIGFAIPINLAKHIVNQLKDKGKVIRGWLGVVVQTVTPELAQSFGLDEGKGALIADVDKDGPAAHAGIKTGDVIVAFNGQDIKEMADLPLIVAETSVGKKVPVVLIRGAERETVNVIIGEMKGQQVEQINEREQINYGMTVREITPELASRHDLEQDSGVIIIAVEPNSSAEEAGLRQGDIILEINRTTIKNLSEYYASLQGKNVENILMLIKRDRSTLWIALKPMR